MKNSIKYVLQKIMGLQSYLYVFALYKIRTLRTDKHENDFFAFLDLIQDGKGSVLDIGANLGVMTYHLAKKLPHTTIHAFEPMPTNNVILKRIIANFDLKNAKIHEYALGENKGTAKMVLPVNGYTVMHGLSHIKHESIKEWNIGREVEVAIEKLDDIIGDEPVQGIKIDVENFEYFALKGGEKMLSTYHPIIYAELWVNENRQQCFKLLKKLNYSVFVHDDKKLVPFNSQKHETQNFIFIAE